MKIRPALLVVLASSFPFALGCSSTTTPAPAGGDAGSDSGVAADANAAADTGAAAVNGCTAFEDHTGTADTRTLTWDLSIAGATSRCMKISAGQSVVWSGSFTSHPLLVQGGSTPNPIANVDTTTGKVTFAAVGTFGYVCGIHSTMNGAILVVP